MDIAIADTASRIFRELNHDPQALWATLSDMGLTKAMVPASLGGSGLSPKDGFGLIKIFGGADANIPFAETVLAGFILSVAGLETPKGKISIFQNDSSQIPFGDTADYILHVTKDGQLNLFEPVKGQLAHSTGIDPVLFANIQGHKPVLNAKTPEWMNVETFKQICGLARSAQICGAIDIILSQTLKFTAQREQFGRPLTKFQAIQHQLAKMAGEAAACSAVVDAAIESISFNEFEGFRPLAFAKIRTSEAAGIVAAIAHQTHGAIGYTQDYKLGNFTRRLWRWREDFGNETYWSKRLGEDLARAKSGSLITEIFGA